VAHSIKVVDLMIKKAMIPAIFVALGGVIGRIVYELLWSPCSDALIEAAHYLEIEINCNTLTWQNIAIWLLGGFIGAFLVALIIELAKKKLKNIHGGDEL